MGSRYGKIRKEGGVTTEKKVGHTVRKEWPNLARGDCSPEEK